MYFSYGCTVKIIHDKRELVRWKLQITFLFQLLNVCTVPCGVYIHRTYEQSDLIGFGDKKIWDFSFPLSNLAGVSTLQLGHSKRNLRNEF